MTFSPSMSNATGAMGPGGVLGDTILLLGAGDDFVAGCFAISCSLPFLDAVPLTDRLAEGLECSQQSHLLVAGIRSRALQQRSDDEAMPVSSQSLQSPWRCQALVYHTLLAWDMPVSQFLGNRDTLLQRAPSYVSHHQGQSKLYTMAFGEQIFGESRLKPGMLGQRQSLCSLKRCFLMRNYQLADVSLLMLSLLCPSGDDVSARGDSGRM
jgi:hypothetical protein